MFGMGRILLAALLASAAGCVGDVPTGPSGGGDGGGSGGVRSDAGGLVWIDAAPGTGSNLPCKNQVSPAPQNGHHNQGKSCFQSCHDHGFTLAGTLYTSATSNTGRGGASITVKDAGGAMLDVVVNTDGNFYTRQAISFPVLVIASACPSARRMEGSTPNGDCNAGGCHAGGTANQMYLP